MGLSRSPLTTFCFELHRSWLRARTVSAVRWARFLSVLAVIRSEWDSTEVRRDFRDVTLALGDYRDARAVLRIERRYTAKALLRATRSTLRSSRSLLRRLWTDRAALYSCLANRACRASWLHERPVSPALSGRVEYFTGKPWTLADLEALRRWEQSFPQRFIMGVDPRTSSVEWLEAITTWPNPFVMEGTSEILTVEGTGEPWVAPELWDAAKVSAAEGWDRNPISLPITDPELYQFELPEPPVISPYQWYGDLEPPLMQFPKPEPPTRATMVLAEILNKLAEEGLLREDPEAAKAAQATGEEVREHPGHDQR